MGFLVYLAGPITGLSHRDCTSWRNDFSTSLPHDIDGLDPMRGKGYLVFKESIADSYEGTVLSSQKAITTRDYNDVRRADMVVANVLGAETVSIGTVMEIAWAKAHEVPVVLVIEPSGNPHDHAMVRECCGFRVDSLEAARYVVVQSLHPDPHNAIRDAKKLVEIARVKSEAQGDRPE